MTREEIMQAIKSEVVVGETYTTSELDEIATKLGLETAFNDSDNVALIEDGNISWDIPNDDGEYDTNGFTGVSVFFNPVEWKTGDGENLLDTETRESLDRSYIAGWDDPLVKVTSVEEY